MPNLTAQLNGAFLLDVGDTIHGLAGTATAITYTIFGVQCVQSPTGPQFLGTVLAQAQLATTDSILYTVPLATSASISQIILSNTTSSAVTGVQLGVNGSSATAGFQIISSLTIPANGNAVWINGTLTVYDANGNIYATGSLPFDNTLPAPTLANSLGTAGTATTAAHRDHVHESPGGMAAIVAASAGIQNVETQIVGQVLPANFFQAGTTIEVLAYGTITSTVSNNITFNLRIGPTTLTGNIPAALTDVPGNSGTVTAAKFILRAFVTIRTAGAGGTAYGSGTVISASTGAAVTQAMALANEIFTPTSVTVNTTVQNVAELTCVTAATTTTVTFQAAILSLLKP